jgi:ribonucleoside-diphosphate reductase beta chain
VRDATTDVADGVLVYHLVLEGLVFNSGQHALLERLEHLPLPGLRAGVERVARDERWHVGLGVRVLQERGLDADAAAALAAEARPALAVWGDLLSAEQRDHYAALHLRRMRASRLVREMYPAVHHAGS